MPAADGLFKFTNVRIRRRTHQNSMASNLDRRDFNTKVTKPFSNLKLIDHTEENVNEDTDL